MKKTQITITLGGVDYKVHQFCVRQYREFDMSAARYAQASKSDDAEARAAAYWDRVGEVVAIALSPDYPELSPDVPKRIVADDARVAMGEIFNFLGLVPVGEPVAAASTGSLSTDA